MKKYSVERESGGDYCVVENPGNIVVSSGLTEDEANEAKVNYQAAYEAERIKNSV